MGTRTKPYWIDWTADAYPGAIGYRIYYVDIANEPGVTYDSRFVNHYSADVTTPGDETRYDLSLLPNIQKRTYTVEIGIRPLPIGIDGAEWMYKAQHTLVDFYLADECWDLWLIDPRLQIDPSDLRFCDRVSFSDIRMETTATQAELKDAAERWWGGNWPYHTPEWQGTLAGHNFDETKRSEQSEGRLDKEFMIYTGMNANLAERVHISPKIKDKEKD
jgi:hypothetical protein